MVATEEEQGWCARDAAKRFSSAVQSRDEFPATMKLPRLPIVYTMGIRQHVTIRKQSPSAKKSGSSASLVVAQLANGSVRILGANYRCSVVLTNYGVQASHTLSISKLSWCVHEYVASSKPRVLAKEAVCEQFGVSQAHRSQAFGSQYAIPVPVLVQGCASWVSPSSVGSFDLLTSETNHLHER